MSIRIKQQMPWSPLFDTTNKPSKTNIVRFEDYILFVFFYFLKKKGQLFTTIV